MGEMPARWGKSTLMQSLQGVIMKYVGMKSQCRLRAALGATSSPLLDPYIQAFLLTGPISPSFMHVGQPKLFWPYPLLTTPLTLKMTSLLPLPPSLHIHETLLALLCHRLLPSASPSSSCSPSILLAPFSCQHFTPDLALPGLCQPVPPPVCHQLPWC